MNALQYQLDVVKTAAIENGGDIDAPGSVVNQRNGDAPALDQLVFVTTQ